MSLLGFAVRGKYKLARLLRLRPFLRRCGDQFPAMQKSFLQRLLRRHADTEYGRQFDFASIRGPEEFRDRVPIIHWGQLKPWVDRIIAGEPGVLFPARERLLMLALSSGTTSEPKRIPVTETSYRDFGRYWSHTWYGLLRHRERQVTTGRILYFPGDPRKELIGDIPCGAITSAAYVQQGPITRRMYPYPLQVARIKEFQVRYYTIMRLALEHSVQLIPIANPATILALFRTAREQADRMIEDIRQGVIRYQDALPEDLRKTLTSRVRPRPDRAAELESIYRKTGDFLPRHYWAPDIAVACFASGPLGYFLGRLKDYLGNPVVGDLGLIASEGRFTFPLGPLESWPGCCPCLETNYFEFVPEEDSGKSRPQVLTLEELEQGKRYLLVVTNAAGLFRYDLNDVVEVTGFYGRLPLLRFSHKGRHVSNLVGEKLTEYQLARSVQRACTRVGIHLRDFLTLAEPSREIPSYSILTSSEIGRQGLQRLVDDLDLELMRSNNEYQSKRESGRLGPLRLRIAERDSYLQYCRRKQQAASSLAQYKHAFLLTELDPQIPVCTTLTSRIGDRSADRRKGSAQVGSPGL